MDDRLPPLLPRALLFGNPEKQSPKLSPDGTRLAYIAPRDGVMNVFVRTVGQEDDRAVTFETVRPIRGFGWSEDGRFIFYPQDAGGNENFHIFCASIEGEGEPARDLTPGENVRANIVGTEPSLPGVILLSTNARDPRMFDIYRYDLETDESTLLVENPGNVVGWVPDRTLQVRGAVATRPDGGSDVWVRDSPDAEWRTLLSVPFGETASPLAFSDDGTTLFVLTNEDVNTIRLYAFDPKTGEPTLLSAREDVDLSGVLMHPTEHRVQAVAFNRMRNEWEALDPEVEGDLAALKAALIGDWGIVSRDNADKTWLIAETRDDGAARYHTYDRATKAVTLLFVTRPELEEWTLAKMLPVEITARDGLVLPAYLTLPTHAEPGTPQPLILDVHGGPWARDTWGFNGEAQWLANRGYAVLQVNFRGSTGFGKAHLNAGNREWAAKMHDDLVDAVNWAVEQGYADPARVAIMGGSYGGYATLVGLTFTPELFTCGVDVVGPSNLLTLLESIPPYWAPLKAQFVQRVGDPETEPDFLKSRSPFFFAERIVRPLFVAQGANDPRVKKAESDQIVAAARKNGKDVTYLLFEDEGHGFARPENRFKYTAAAEEFLARHMGGRFEPAHPGEEPPLVTE